MSLTPEVGDALELLAGQMQMERSRLIETLLRENSLLRNTIEQLRGARRDSGTKKGRTLAKILVLARTSNALWEASLRSGRVKVRGLRP